jgi:YebC/PmpR family DNA-binding regulatory protein
MSGHSKWSKIKRAKGITDAKRSSAFTKLARDITVAAQEAGGDPDMNFTLRLAIDKAKDANMPKDNIERSIKRGTGELKSEVMYQNTYEAVAAEGVGLLIDTTSDNTNRTVSEVKNIIDKTGAAKVAAPGSVSWQFSEEGEIEVGVAKLKKSEKFGHEDAYEDANLEDLEGELLELDGVIDYQVYDPATDPNFEASEKRPASRKYIYIRVERSALARALKSLSDNNWQVLDSDLIKHPNSTIDASEQTREKVARLIEELEESEDVDDIWTNIKDF